MALEIKYKLSKISIDSLLDAAKSVNDDNTKGSFLVRCDDVNILWDNFMKHYVSIEASKKAGFDKDEHLREYIEYEEKFYEIKRWYKQYGGILNKTEITEISDSKKPCNNLAIPKIKLPSFDGNISDYLSFHNIFTSLVHNNDSLTGVQKMHYLVGCLQKEPFRLIQHLSLSNENYIVAYNLIEKRYHNKRKIAEKHLGFILSAPNIQSGKLVRPFLNILSENISALKAMNFDTDGWSFILFYICTRKLSVDLRNRFEVLHTGSELPTFNQLLDFLENECRAMDASNDSSSSSRFDGGNTRERKCFSAVSVTCVCCDADHLMHACERFLKMNIVQRRQFVKDKKLCWNCLGAHFVNRCRSKSTCKTCGKNHHTLLHQGEQNSSSSSSSRREEIVNTVSCSTSCIKSEGYLNTVFLATAMIHVQDISGNFHSVRALLDPGSQCSIITETCMQRLNLKRRRSHITVSGVGQNTHQTRGEVICCIKSVYAGSPLLKVNAYILNSITGNLPTHTISSDIRREFNNIVLADPDFYTSRPVDMILGADIYNDIMDGKRINFDPQMPSAYSTIFGYVIMGKATLHDNINNGNSTCFSHSVTINDMMERFWKIEELPSENLENVEDQKCEEDFVKTLSRAKDGRFIVGLPFRENHEELGMTKSFSLRRFYALEGKLLRNPSMKLEYMKVIQEYINLGHMEEASISNIKYFLSHHGVIKESSSTTRLRVVFDASMKSDNGISLNDVLYCGTKLQNNIADIIFKFRLHNIVFTADVQQMYRQILVHTDDRNYQGVFWRNSPEEELKVYRLATVTFGVSSSPFLAIRCLLELAKIGLNTHPHASRILQGDIYVDDIVSGASSIKEALEFKTELTDLLGSAGFHLRKWCSNSEEFLSHISQDCCEKPRSFDNDDSCGFRVLGIQWIPQGDYFKYQVQEFNTNYTKRAILSHIAKIFDPCGWLTPVTFAVKVIIQEIWLLKLDWDDTLPQVLIRKWKNYVSQFSELGKVKIERKIFTSNKVHCELHGFSDASQLGYGIAVYLRSEDMNGNVTVQLLMGKSKVAPIKQKLTIPRMELCGVLLLARALNHLQNVWRDLLQFDITAWCDSQVVLAWLKTPVHQLRMFEGNRVSQIHSMCNTSIWRYVPSSCNPADASSRGLLPRELVDHSLWWGPEWLRRPRSEWPRSQSDSSNAVAQHVISCEEVSLHASYKADEWDIFERYSSFSKLLRVIALCKRFIHNVRNKGNANSGSISASERNMALNSLVKNTQSSVFHHEISLIHKGKAHSTSMRRLNPFIDSHGILRVGGRLHNAQLDYGSKHPIIIPKNHPLTRLIILHFHIQCMHAGASLTLSVLRQQFWILSGRSIVRQVIHKCIQCFRVRPKNTEPLMAPLPECRVHPGRAFLKVGCDFGGPFFIKTSKLRNAKLLKSYLCIFVCMSTKAVHLEIVSDLSTPGFLAALDRFVARRGLCSDIYSDWGTNFVGADNHIKEVRKFLLNKSSSDEVSEYLSERGMIFHRNPPGAPHMGGLWESNIKSVKTHLRRVIGETHLTFEEFYTVLTKVEAMLNSRPLISITDNIDDLNVLTPGHFIVGSNLLNIPEIYTDSEGYRNRWEMLQKFSQQIWRRWSREYLHNLNQRPKWQKNVANLRLGDLVIVKEDNLPPMKWKMARITKLHPGADGVIRVVTIKTSTGVFTRPVVKICPLPL